MIFFTVNSPLLIHDATCSKLWRYKETLGDKKLSVEHSPKDEAGSGSFSGQRNSGALTGVGVLLRVGLRIPCYTE